MFQNIKSRIHENEVLKIIALAIFDNSPSGIASMINKYISSDKLNLYGWVENGEVLGICGFEILGDKIEINSIAVAENVQKSGVGRKMIFALQSEYNLPIIAETDNDAVGFYRKIGFTTTEFIHPRWNVTRYKCVLNIKNELKLKVPTIDELEYRRFLISDSETMQYNQGYGDNGGSTYIQSPEQAQNWLNYWQSQGNFYAYVVRVSDNVPVGEVSIHFPSDYGFPKQKGIGFTGVVIEGKHRKKGYGEQALRLIADYAFNNMGLKRLVDDIPIEREYAIRIFERVGFRRVEVENLGEVMELTNPNLT